ncbi:serine/threonine-protein kinase RIO3-like [Uloborus diversus]|uniref:serine/threonine-protein kinase RIO3-like n=1 Tax=Uloborus diversus TaxID=327109 RepID=UPI0024097DEF|nr:serine/threonine-protein kinase RIO3-like [Uloborus diversus]XP_054707437.1 serine/threonine-protein kinase RIO3-like [Uloborus diversus]XP_054707438.1 serine/threonine-protein kinase RIO3-like [Uloborus diversus]XP_054707439.1 serine/threonine-protein kinase RIO3-like [Uloborus diversus]
MEATEVIIPSSLLKPVPESTTSNILVEIGSSPCPWGQVKVIETISLNDVMSEQLAKSLIKEDEIPHIQEDCVFTEDLNCCAEITDCSDDFLLAKMLQQEYDKELDSILKQEEMKFNQKRKVKISYGKYRRCSQDSVSSDEEEDKEYFLEQSAKKHWQNFEQAEKALQAVGKSGVSRQGNTTTTKHDPTLSGRRNAGKLMELCPEISTGDGGMFDMKLSNNVYNTLKVHSTTEEKRRNKIHEKKDKSTAEKALDEKTHLILYKLVNNQTLDSLSGCISVGKEACVYHAWSGLPEEESVSTEFAIKVFKTTLNEFQNRDQYIRDDHRFRYRFGKQNPRKVIHMWAEKEMRNLQRMRQADLPCPEVIALKKHVLVMSFIGKERLPAPKLKDVDLPFADMTILYEQTLEIMCNLYTKCKLIHADLSEYNLLWHDDKVWVIDVSQAVEITHPLAQEFLLRDCTNITSFFEKKGVLNVHSAESLFSEVCGHPPKVYGTSDAKVSQTVPSEN